MASCTSQLRVTLVGGAPQRRNDGGGAYSLELRGGGEGGWATKLDKIFAVFGRVECVSVFDT